MKTNFLCVYHLSLAIMDRLFINKMLHKAFVEVNEKGTEAAAATAVMMSRSKSAPITVPFTPTFKADLSFLFLIRDRITGNILFMGRINDPRMKKSWWPFTIFSSVRG